MNISKQISAIKDCFKYERDVDVMYHVSTFDSNIVTYYVTWTVGNSERNNRKLELTVEKSKIIWIVTDAVGITIQQFDRLKKSIKEAK